MNLRKIQQLAEQAEQAKEQITRIDALFNYDTRAEQEQKRPGSERIDRCDLTIQIGGPSVHAVLGGFSRAELEELRPVLRTICGRRTLSAELQLQAELGQP